MSSEKFPLSNNSVKYLDDTVNRLTMIAKDLLKNAKADDYADKIMANKILLAINNELVESVFGFSLKSFPNQYPVANLKKQLVVLIYDWSKVYPERNSADLKLKADLLKEGVSYDANYKDIKKQYSLLMDKYYFNAANEFYNQGKAYVNNKNFRAAANSFTNAATVYKPKGKYKDALELAQKYDKQDKTQTAQSYYNTTMKYLGPNATKDHYRIAVGYLKEANKEYKPYGNFANTAQLIRKYSELGKLRIYIANNEYSSLIINALDEDFVAFVNCSSCADIVINMYINPQSDYTFDPGYETTKQGYDKVQDGYRNVTLADGTTNQIPNYREYHFNVHTTIQKAYVSIEGYISLSGLTSQNYFLKGSSHSEKITHRFSGDVPPNKVGYNKEKIIDKKQLIENAYDDIISNAEKKLRSIPSKLRSL